MWARMHLITTTPIVTCDSSFKLCIFFTKRGKLSRSKFRRRSLKEEEEEGMKEGGTLTLKL
jgi:hypothetical protein